MGMCVVGLGVLGVGILYIIFEEMTIITGLVWELLHCSIWACWRRYLY